mgnify:CR=1 FL=1
MNALPPWVFAVLLACLCPIGAWCAAPLGQGYDFVGNGKRSGQAQAEVWRIDPWEGTASLAFSGEVKKIAINHLRSAVGERPKGKVKCGNLSISTERWGRTTTRVAEALAGNGDLASMGILRYRCRGEDEQGNVHFTGYFTPRLNARRLRDVNFRFPLYRLPSIAPGAWPTRIQIDQEGALAGQGLEIAWTDNLLDLYFLHVQGSGQLVFPDGTVERMRYAGGNGYKYKSLGQYLVQRKSIAPEAISLRSIREWFTRHPEELVPLLNLNPSYTFFESTHEAPRGTGAVDLVPGLSVAADTRFFPLGACLLAEVPHLNEAGRLQGYELRLLFVHDTGGAIQGPGHLDLYHGVGSELGEKAGDLHHYGRIWLLLAKESKKHR